MCTRLGVVTCMQRARGSGQAFHGARTRGKTDGSVIATLKQGHSVSAADTAILRGCIILVQSLHYPPVNRSETGHALFFRFPAAHGQLDVLGKVYALWFSALYYKHSCLIHDGEESLCVPAM